tara:strand:- start:345 stop:1328 length:984 start_codon:yes stop_codon:yes gene_type:complete
MKKLKLKDLYSREEVHGIFSPETTFTAQAGTWGLQGIIKVPNIEGDFVFFVTYGQSQGGHEFDEGVTEDGVLSWQSQAEQTFKSNVIKTLISHNETTNNIYLFLRKDKKEKDGYQYLGRLKYLNHDKEREKPIYFQWQLIDIDSYEEDQKDDYFVLTKEIELGKIKLVNKLPNSKQAGTTKKTFRTTKSPDYALKESKNRKLGIIGELLVIKHEEEYLRSINREDLARKIIHVSKVEGDGAGYDIKSFNGDGEVRYIEVKTTRGNIDTDFYMSPRELLFSQKNSKNFFLYRVHNLDKKTNYGEFFIFNGDIDDSFKKIPTSFRMSKK